MNTETPTPSRTCLSCSVPIPDAGEHFLINRRPWCTACKNRELGGAAENAAAAGIGALGTLLKWALIGIPAMAGGVGRMMVSGRGGMIILGCGIALSAALARLVILRGPSHVSANADVVHVPATPVPAGMRPPQKR